MSLTDLQIRKAKAGIKPTGTTTDKPYKMTDGDGLYLEVSPKGSAYAASGFPTSVFEVP